MKGTSDRFLQLFARPAPALRVKYRATDEEARTIRVQHWPGPAAGALTQESLASAEKGA
jgi:hypothetical protein